MDLFSELVAGVQSDLNVGGESTLFDPATIKLAINRAYRKAAAMFKWPALRDALKTSTVIDQEYYDYPVNWKPDSIWKVRVDGSDLGEPLTLKDYYFEQENNYQGGRKTIWANQKNRFFITIEGDTPDTNGDNNIEVWGSRTPDKLSGDGDVTIFSYDMPECNEAIILEALAILRIKGGEQPIRQTRYIQGSLLLSYVAQEILQTAWLKVAEEQAKLQKTTPAFDVPDFFASRGQNAQSIKNKIGNF